MSPQPSRSPDRFSLAALAEDHPTAPAQGDESESLPCVNAQRGEPNLRVVDCSGARRDEEKSRAKERVYSFRDSKHRWDPKNQRPELWNIYNGKVKKGESIRVFPLSNWTELDIWQYIYLEGIPIVPLYFAAEREVIEKNGTLIMIDDERILEHLSDEEKARIEKRMVRFRTLGCYPLTGAVESSATTLPEIIQEMLLTRTSERQGRVIDHDQAGSMEEKKRQGYF